jgi:hypothetical protein
VSLAVEIRVAVDASHRTLEDRAHLHRRPCATTSCRNTSRGQCPCNAAKGFDAASLNFPDHRQNVGRVTVCPLFPGHRGRASDSLGFPNRFPRALAAWRAAGVRALMISRSCWATAAKICTVSLFACGLSTAMNSTPESMSVAIKARLRDRRSSLAMTSLAFSFLQAASALSSSGRSLRLPLSISVNSATSDQRHLLRSSKFPDR